MIFINIHVEMEKYEDILYKIDINDNECQECKLLLHETISLSQINLVPNEEILLLKEQIKRLFQNAQNLKLEAKFKEEKLLEFLIRKLIDIYNDLDEDLQDIVEADLYKKNITFLSTNEDILRLDYDISSNRYIVSYYDGMQAPWTILNMPRDINLLYNSIIGLFK